MKSLSVLVVMIGIIAIAAATPLTAQLNLQIGNGVLVNTTTSYPAPYGNYWWGARQQYIYRAGDILGACLTPGANTITTIAWDVTNVNTGQPLANFVINMGLTAQTDASAWVGGLTNVFSSALYTPAVGWNIHTLSAPFAWDGTSNIVVETCSQNTSYTQNCSFNQSATSFVSTRLFRQDAAGVCANAGLTSTHSQRPNTRFDFASGSILPTQYQANQANLSLLVNGAVLPGTCAPAVSTQTIYACAPVTPATGSVVLSTNQIGGLWDLAISGSNLVGLSSGGLALPDGQIINVDGGYLAGGSWLKEDE